MELYDKNCKALQKQHPELYRDYLSYKKNDDTNRDFLNVELLQARDGNTIIAVTDHGQTVRLNSSYAPAKEAERWAKQFDFTKSATHVFLFGMGNGMFVRQLLREQKQDGAIFLEEPDLELFDALLQLVDLSDLLENDRIYLKVGALGKEQWEQKRSDYVHWTNESHCIVCYHTGYDRLYQKEYQDFQKEIHLYRKKMQVNKATQVYFGKSSVVNTLKNLSYIKEGRLITQYQQALPKGLPVMVVAAGPSLDKNIEQLKDAKDHAMILAVDTAVRSLLAHGIIPDAMVTLDAEKPASYLTLPMAADIPLFCCMEANTEIMQYHRGIKIWFKPGLLLNDYAKRFDKQFMPYEAGGSVATAAFEIALMLGADTVVLVGQDLAYEGEITHAGGEVSAIIGEENSSRIVPGITGDMVKTRGDWYQYLLWFVEAVARCKDTVKVIDATEGGALIRGTEVMTLHEVIDQYCNTDYRLADLLQSRDPMFSEEEYSVLRREIEHYSEELQEIQSCARQATMLCDKMLASRKQDPALLALCQQQVLQYNNQMQEKHIYPVVDIYISDATAKYVEQKEGQSDQGQDSWKQMVESAKMIYDRVIQAAQDLFVVVSENRRK